MELTLIARCRDGLILATSIDGSSSQNVSVFHCLKTVNFDLLRLFLCQTDANMVKYTNQAKMIFKKLAGSPAQQSVESGPFVFQ